MNKLGLVQELAKMTGSIPVSEVTTTTLASPSAKLEKLIGYIDTAYLEIQVAQNDWAFMITQGGVINTVQGTRYYDPTASQATLESVYPFTAYDTRRYIQLKNDANDTNPDPIWYLPWKQFAGLYDRRTTEGRPYWYTIRPDGYVGFELVPSEAFRVEFQYKRLPDTLDNATDTPIIPARFHLVIVYWALEHYALYSESPEQLARATSLKGGLYQRLLNDQLPEWRMFGA